ncbi:GntR family transcriptional regulator [Roseitranquillus sediminis]|uniref:GntR family transcriptional regulator n=1 Tax=Roseitranquillus sediminis TaxID=2809051 RepID=UPI001D0C86ED|nr:GntR family transcriptional regulator [Roseitranquillus sediminis]MBM9592990.1 GntR family transcriptional regulator [Roseitranquillus sediminis]
MSRAQEIYETLIGHLRTGTYKPGDRIRAEDVAKTFDVSRTPVREALSRLQERGLLEMTATGLAVAKLTRPSVLELYAIRELLEGAAARYAAQHASPSDLYSMRHIAQAFAEPTDDPGRAAQLNRAFHDAIAEAAHNRYLVNMLHGMHDTVMLLPSTTFAVEGRQPAAVAEHAALLDAIERRDPDAAERLAQEHIRHARDTRLAMMFDY